MQRTHILNLNIRQSKLYGLAKNAVLLFLFLFFSMFGKSFVQSGSLFKEVFSRVAAEDLVCVSQFAINELGRLYFAVKTAVAALTMCMSFFSVCRIVFSAFRRNRGLSVRFVKKCAVARFTQRRFFAPLFIPSALNIKSSLASAPSAEIQSDFFRRLCLFLTRFLMRRRCKAFVGRGRIFSCLRLKKGQEKNG